MAWYDHSWLVAGATLLSALAVLLELRLISHQGGLAGLDEVKRLAPTRFREPDGRIEISELRQRFKGRHLSTSPSWGERSYRRALAGRIVSVAQLSDTERERDMALIVRYVNATNDMADLVDFGLLRSRILLSKYHLALARELFLVEPYIYYRALFEERGRWGYRVLRLGEMARTYNDINPIHRLEIKLNPEPGTDERWVIYPAPGRGRALVRSPYWALCRIVGRPTISARTKRRQNRRAKSLHRMVRDIEASRAGEENSGAR